MLKRILTLAIVLLCLVGYAQNDSIATQKDSIAQQNDSLNIAVLKEYNQRIALIEQQRKNDSIKKAELEAQIKTLKTADNLKKEELQRQLKEIETNEEKRIIDKKIRIDSLRKTAIGYPVTGVLKDTLFYIYSRLGASKPSERAAFISKRIENLYKDDFLKTESIIAILSENTYDIVYGEQIIMTISETDALWYNKPLDTLAKDYASAIKDSLTKAKAETSITKLILRIGLVIIVIGITWLLVWLIGKGYHKLLNFLVKNKSKWIKDLSYKEYTFLSAEQEMRIALFLFKGLHWFVYAILLYITIPIIFSIFPFSRNWADTLFNLIWSPFKSMLAAIWAYLPNLFSILVIYIVMKYFIKFVKYFFNEVDSGKLKLSGFHPDWAMPTYSIIKFLLYAFMFVLIFPYLPGSDSHIFQGVSVFIGLLFSLGSSSAIANMVAGLVITYMRPFKIGDRIKIADIMGDVVEKTLLVTRVRTPKNEIITIPNSSILTGNTINYSSDAVENGLILYTTVTIGYDVPWRDTHKALIDAALKTELVLKDPKPFVLQTSLDDFYVSYQLNVYVREAGKQASIYSNLHQNIQDIFFERGIEILSPHYRAQRDGNTTTIPANYLPKDYKAPSFNIKTDTNNDK